MASVDAQTGATTIIGLPRNFEHAVFSEGSPLYQEFPNGYDCESCTLNSLATWAADHKALFGDSAIPEEV